MDYKAKKIFFKAKKQVFSGMLGNNSSLFKGQGFDFLELREYQDGDDVKHIDWIITAKKHKPFVKIFHEQRQLNITVAPLLTGSLHFGTKALKYELLAHVYAILGFVALKNKENCRKIFVPVSPMPQKLTSFHQIENDIQALLNYDYLGKETKVKQLASVHLKKSLFFCIGDFVGDYDLSHLAIKHDVVAIIIRDRFEENPRELGFIHAIDTNSKKVSQLNFSQEFCTQYKKTIAQNDKKLYANFRKHKIRFIKIYTDEDPYKKLLSL
jgi:uncharacterized protein (DUF58 family)